MADHAYTEKIIHVHLMWVFGVILMVNVTARIPR